MFPTFFRVQVFYSPGFSGSKLFWVRVQVLEVACRSVISIKLQSNFIEIVHWHGCSPVNMLHIFRTPFLKNTFRTRHSFFPVGFTNFLRTLFYRTLPGDCFWWIGLMVKNFNFVWLIFLNSQLYHAPPEWWLLFWCNEEHFLMKKTLTKF